MHEPSIPPLILASGSTSRKTLMQRLGLEFTTLAANIDETPLAGETPEALVERLSRAKAASVAAQARGGLVIGSDQVAVLDGSITGKPGTIDRAVRLLARFSGREIEFLTGVAVHGKSQCEYFLDRTTVKFRVLSGKEIRRYISADSPLDCAGCFRLEALGPALFESVRTTDPTALLGLPLIRLCHALRQHGFRLP